jgi:iron-sulfur cluster insertion protein
MHVTSLAVDKVRDILKAQGLEELGLRVMVVGGGCSGFTYDMDFEDKINPGDWELEFEGLSVVVDPMSYAYLDGTKIDYIESFQFSGFHFENPNAKSTCGCGSSFAV